jgi:isoquinoline 1-oxidoreductase subunit alpha
VILDATAVGMAAIAAYYPPNGKCTSDRFFRRYDSIAAATHNPCRRLIFIASRMDRHHSLRRHHPGGCHLNKKKMSSAVSGFHTPAGKETMPNLNINGRNLSVEAANDTPLLWVIREQLQMTGTKFGCGAGLCGACTVHINGEAVRSCQTQVSEAVGKKITTIEGLSAKGDHPLQKAWIAEQVPQCGYCQSGQIMQAASLLAKNSNPTKDEVVAHMDGNLCRCMTYSRIQKAIMRAATEMRTASNAGTERRAT